MTHSAKISITFLLLRVNSPNPQNARVTILHLPSQRPPFNSPSNPLTTPSPLPHLQKPGISPHDQNPSNTPPQDRSPRMPRPPLEPPARANPLPRTEETKAPPHPPQLAPSPPPRLAILEGCRRDEIGREVGAEGRESRQDGGFLRWLMGHWLEVIRQTLFDMV